jgi:hypothetical protein
MIDNNISSIFISFMDASSMLYRRPLPFTSNSDKESEKVARC